MTAPSARTANGSDPVAVAIDALAHAGCRPRRSRGVAAVARCPMCRTDDAVTVRTGPDGAPIIACDRGCGREDILRAAGLRERDVRPIAPAAPTARNTRTARPTIDAAADDALAAQIAGAAGLSLEALRAEAAQTEYHAGPQDRADGIDRARVVDIADVAPEHVEWLWLGRIPMGAITVIDGDPGAGKSTLTLAIAAAVTAGRPLPGDDGPREPSDVVLVSYEDAIGATIRPRLEAAGADLRRAHAIVGVGADGRPVAIPDDLGEVERVVVGVGARLVVVDPLMAALAGDVDAHRDQDVRRALAAMAAMADRTGAAVVIVRHPRKGSDGPAIYRGGGSIGIIGAARSGLLVAADPDDPDGRVLAHSKSNLAPLAPSLRFRVVGHPDLGCGVVAWGETCGVTADELVARLGASAGEAPALAEAADWLREALADGPRPVRELRDAAREAGIAWRTVQRARSRAGVIADRAGWPGRGMWALSRAITVEMARLEAGPDSAPRKSAESPQSRQTSQSRQAPGYAADGATVSPAAEDALGGAPWPRPIHPRGCRCAGDECAVGGWV